MKVALVHDYIKEYGGAERVLEALYEIFPDAPIYTAFYKKDSLAYKRFKNRKIIPSWVHYIPFFATKLHSPLRFLAPYIWGSFDFSEYDIVISSASWYVTKGFGNRVKSQITNHKSQINSNEQNSKCKSNKKRPIEICYCHTPPRWLYGYKTSVEWQKFWPVKVYGTIIKHFMRMYDFKQAQKVDYFIANSNEVKERIKKFYRREAKVIYPPVHLKKSEIRNPKSEINPNEKSRDYYFIVSRLVGTKGIELAVEAAEKLGFKLKIAGAQAGYASLYKNLSKKTKSNVEFLGYVTDCELSILYSKAKAFLALSFDEDFGITPVEAMLCGTPVIAFNGGGYKETVVNAKTGILFNELTVEGFSKALRQFETLRQAQGKKLSEACIAQAQKFSKERFKKEIKEFVENHCK